METNQWRCPGLTVDELWWQLLFDLRFFLRCCCSNSWTYIAPPAEIVSPINHHISLCWLWPDYSLLLRLLSGRLACAWVPERNYCLLKLLAFARVDTPSRAVSRWATKAPKIDGPMLLLRSLVAFRSCRRCPEKWAAATANQTNRGEKGTKVLRSLIWFYVYFGYIRAAQMTMVARDPRSKATVHWTYTHFYGKK